MKINTKHGFYERSQYYRNSTSPHMLLNDKQHTSGLITTPSETSMTRLPEDDKDCSPGGTDTTDPLWYSSDEGTDEEADDSSCIVISHKALSSANEAAGRYDEESGIDAKPIEKTNSSTGVRSSRRVRFSDAPPDVCSYEKPGIDCYNELFYTGHEMQKMQLEYFMEMAEMESTCAVGCEDLWNEDEDSD
jgi:hypothetical protein